MKIYIFEDGAFTNLSPLVYFRPIYELKCGALSLFQKIEKYFKVQNIGFICRADLSGYISEQYPEKSVNKFSDDFSLLINGRVIVDEKFVDKLKLNNKKEMIFKNDETIIAAFLSYQTLLKYRSKFLETNIAVSDFVNIPVKEIDAQIINYPWDLIKFNGSELLNDFKLLAKNKKVKISGKINKGVFLLNKNKILIGKGTVVQPGVVLNAENGPIIIGENVTIMSNAVIIGPAFIGDNSIIKVGAKIYSNTTIGEVCKVGGEVDACIIHSYSNKQHDGYLGHAYVCSWVNIGADTNNSDLKNNYSNVKVKLNGHLHDTGMQLFGMLIGDHSKTGINMMFDTGTIVGVCCNLYGEGLPSRYIPSFVRGTASRPLKTHSIEMAYDIAKLVMARRNIQTTTSYEELFKKVFDKTVAERQREKIL